MFVRSLIATAFVATGVLVAQEAAPVAGGGSEPAPVGEAVKPSGYTVNSGTKVPLSLINSISTKHTLEGDNVYLETAFPVLINGKIVIPVGSYVTGTVTLVKKPGRVKGRGELYVRFDSLMLPNGVTRDFRARIGGIDGTANAELDRTEGNVKSEGNKKGDLQTIGETASAGAGVGGLIGAVAGHPVTGVGIGAAAGAAAGMIGVLLSRGPDAVLMKGTTIEMVLDRSLIFKDTELDFGGYQAPRTMAVTPAAEPQKNEGGLGRRKLPF